jgi:large subunit ribosomal protein L18e
MAAKSKHSTRRTALSKNPELKALRTLFETVARKSTHIEYRTIALRLAKSNTGRPPVTLKRLVEMTEPCHHKLAVVVGKVIGDDRVVEIPHRINVACLAVSDSARKKIEKYGGSVHTLDEIFKLAPTPEAMVLFSGPTKGRRVHKYFGRARNKQSPAFPRILSKGKNQEKRLRPAAQQ